MLSKRAWNVFRFDLSLNCAFINLSSPSARLIDLTEDPGQVPLHQNTPSPSPSLKSRDWSDSELSLPVLPALARVLDNNTESQVECPLCRECFWCSEIEAHASECGIEGVDVVKGGGSRSHGRKVIKLPLVQRGDVSARLLNFSTICS